MIFEKIKEDLAEKIIAISKDDHIMMIKIKQDDLLDVLQYLKTDTQLKFNLLTDLTAVDYPDRVQRFEVIYNLLSIFFNKRVIVKIDLPDKKEVLSVTGIFNAAIWYEREVWDMFGISFINHPDLRRILTDYGFEGHPLRKDFPLSGFKEVRYDELQEKVVYEDIKLPQEFRNFDFLSPWVGPKYVLPGDEKADK